MIDKPETGKASVSKKKVATKKKVSQKGAVRKKVVATKKTSPAPVAAKEAEKTPSGTSTAVTKKAVVKKAVSKKTTVKKAPVSRQKAAPKTAQNPLVSPRERYKMIETMAYYRAEARNFAPGNDEQDWFECEQIIDEMLSKK